MLSNIGDPNQPAAAQEVLQDWLAGADWRVWAVFLAAAVVFVGAALIGHYLLVAGATRLAQRRLSRIGAMAIARFRRPVRWLMVAAAVFLVANGAYAPTGPVKFLSHVLSLALVGLTAWLLIEAVYVLNAIVLLRFEVNVADNLQARKIHTQLAVVRRILIAGIGVVAAGMMLMTFPQIRQLGAAVLASAGIIGIVVGFAAQKTIATLVAGLQIAFTQPIRIDDVVIVEGEWGRIEEITLTYVVVAIWDRRRLIVPITYFIEKPFQNWTRVSAEILGTVFLYVDYTVPVDALRAELQRILEASELWDRKVGGLQVTDASERTIQLRALMSASDASAAWNLRCLVREKLVEFVRRNYPQALPRLRTEVAERRSRGPDAAEPCDQPARPL